MKTKINRRNFIKIAGLSSIGITNLKSFSSIKGANSGYIPPHRIVEIRNNYASNWDYATDPYYDYYDDQVVESMFIEGLCRLTGTSSPREAWETVMNSYNTGDRIAIKLNLNNYGKSNYGQRIDATAPVLNCIICGLVENLGIPVEDIWPFDADKDITADNRVKDRIWDRLVYKNNYRPDPIWSNVSVDWSFDGPNSAYSSYVVEAQHLIDFCLLKTHWMGVSAAFKNHIGSKRWGHVSSNTSDISTGPQLADIYKSPHIKGKTRLIVADAIFGTTGGSGGTVNRFRTCDNGSPNALFFGVDPVAFDSVLWDYLNDETGNNSPHDYLDIAAGEPYNQGIHEHYHDDHEYNNIELIKIKPQPRVTRTDIDRMIKNHKSGLASARNVKALIYRYNRGI